MSIEYYSSLIECCFHRYTGTQIYSSKSGWRHVLYTHITGCTPNNYKLLFMLKSFLNHSFLYCRFAILIHVVCTPYFNDKWKAMTYTSKYPDTLKRQVYMQSKYNSTSYRQCNRIIDCRCTFKRGEQKWPWQRQFPTSTSNNEYKHISAIYVTLTKNEISEV